MPELGAIRERDRAAEVCERCEWGRTNLAHTMTAEKCASYGSCAFPGEHHEFVPGGVSPFDEAEQDRRTLLGYIDALQKPEKGLRDALEAILVRCEEGDKRTDWLPTIANIARTALGRPVPPIAARRARTRWNDG